MKNGVDYFPKDTDFYHDDKVRILRANFGAKGMYTLDYILCELYRQNGYYLQWDKNRCFLVSDGAGCGCSPDYIAEFIQGCLQCGFFDKTVFNASSVLTSRGIQRRYIRMFNSRDNIPIIREYWLLDTSDRNDVPARVLDKITFKNISGTENPDKSTENPDKSTVNTQSKKKVKDTNVSQRKQFSVPAELSEEWNAYVEMRKKIRRPLTDYAASLVLKKLEDLAPGNLEKKKQILQQSVLQGWQGVFPLKQNGKYGTEIDQPPASYDIEEMERRLLYGPIEYKPKE